MLRPRKALAAAPKMHALKQQQQHSRSTAAAFPRSSAKQAAAAQQPEPDSTEAEQPHPLDVIYSTLIHRLAPVASGTSNSGRSAAAAARSPPPAVQHVPQVATVPAPLSHLQQQPPSSVSDPEPHPLLALGPPSPGKSETPAQQLRRREQRFTLIVDAVQTQLANCSGRLHLPSRFISDAEFTYIVRSLPLAGLCHALVTRLVLDGNKITNVHDLPWPPSLTHISLSNNLLTSVAGVRWPPHLRCLNLSCNAIHCAACTSSASSPPPPPLSLPPSRPPLLPAWPPHLTVLDLGGNTLSGSACVGPLYQPHFPYIFRSCVDVLEELLPCCALEQLCIYNNVLDKLQLFTQLLARGYPQPPPQRLQADMNVLPLIR